MPKTKEPANPFYILVVALGVAFLITACGYGTMTYRAIAPGAAHGEPHPLMVWLDRYGMLLLAVELGLLAVATVGAMGLDRFRAGHGPPESRPDEAAELDSRR